MVKTERLGNLDHFLECIHKEGRYIRLTDLPDIQKLKSWFEDIDKGEMLVLCWDNPYGVHAICNGTFGQGNSSEANLSRIRLDLLISELKAEGGRYADLSSRWYYPYPTVDFPVAIFSDAHQPEAGECDDNRYNFQDASMELFDEREIIDRLLATGQYPFFAHAYMLVLSLGGEKETDLLPEYTRFSNERRGEMQIRTDVYKDRVEKSAFSILSGPHIHNLAMTGPKLAKALTGLSVLGKPVGINRLLEEKEGMAVFEFVDGESLETTLDRMVLKGEGELAARLILGFVDHIRSLPNLSVFESSYEFRRWFGDVDSSRICGFDETGKELPVMSLSITDIDMIPQNLLICEEEAVLIDHEWSFTFPVPLDFCVFRFLYYYLEGKYRTMYREPCFEDMYKKAGISESVKQNFLMMETHFQEYVQQSASVLRNEYDMYGKPLIKRWQIQSMLLSSGGHEIVVRYPSQHEETISSTDVERGVEQGSGTRQEVYHYKIPVTESGELILMLPSVRLIRIGILSVIGGRSKEQAFLVNGELLAGCVYYFETDQPKLSVDVSTNQTSYLMLSLEEIPISRDALGEIKTTITDFRSVAENRDKQLEALKSSTSWKLTKPLRMLGKEKE
ncbi:MAG: hypothetical protein J5842_04820 [Lachnospiraceae bacterium]|nr:hypothetical protein [Lachnospiraceae bacterium]